MGGVSTDIVTGNGGTGGRNRAFSFECFAFGINADEPLPPLEHPSSSHSHPDNVVGNHYSSNITGTDHHILPLNALSNSNVSHSMMMPQRPRGDSIIFDPVSFQDGGIHELLPGLLESGNILNDAMTSSLQQPSTSLLPPPTTTIPQPLPARPKTNKMMRKSLQQQATTSSSATATSRSVPAVVSTTNIRSQPHLTTNGAVGSSSSMTSSGTTNVQLQDDLTSATFSLELLNKDGRIGIYLPEARLARIARFHAKRSNRIWRKRIKYDCRKKLADSRPRIKGRFVKRSDMDDDL
jgi:CCT motif